MTKLIQPYVTDQNCADDTYAKPSPAQATFSLGDRICFEITASFAPPTTPLPPFVTDFLPLSTTLEPGSIVVGPNNTLPGNQINLDESLAAKGRCTGRWAPRRRLGSWR